MLLSLPLHTRLVLAVLGIVVLGLAACAAPASTGSVTPESTSTGPVISENAVSVTPVCEPQDLYIDGSIRTNYSLGFENYKNEDYCAALPSLRHIIETDPLFTGGEPDDRNFRRLADTYENLAAMVDSTDQTLRRAYLDSFFVAHDMRKEALENAGLAFDEQADLIARGRFYEIYAADYEDAEQQTFDLYVEAFRLDPNAIDDYYLNYLAARSAVDLEQSEAQELLAEMKPYAEDATYLEAVEASVRAGGALAFGTPEEQYDALLAAYREGDRSADLIRRLAFLDTRLERNEVIDELLPLLAEQNPSMDLYRALGSRACRQGDVEQCNTYFEQAAELATSSAERRDVYYQQASANFRAGQSGDAYRIAGRALELDGNHGPSLYLRASVVARATGGGSVQARAGYWCVADLFRQAANTGDPRIASDARRAAARYSAAGPSSQEYFFLGWRPGQRISASTGYGGCTTTVR